jgi:hypothetical protein
VRDRLGRVVDSGDDVAASGQCQAVPATEAGPVDDARTGGQAELTFDEMDVASVDSGGAARRQNSLGNSVKNSVYQSGGGISGVRISGVGIWEIAGISDNARLLATGRSKTAGECHRAPRAEDAP